MTLREFLLFKLLHSTLQFAICSALVDMLLRSGFEAFWLSKIAFPYFAVMYGFLIKLSSFFAITWQEFSLKFWSHRTIKLRFPGYTAARSEQVISISFFFAFLFSHKDSQHSVGLEFR